jgi:hypothetical protein
MNTSPKTAIPEFKKQLLHLLLLHIFLGFDCQQLQKTGVVAKLKVSAI